MSDERKFAQMYDQYADDIYRYLLVHVHDTQIAEDLMADTFMKAWKALDTFDFSQPRPWLYKIARNLTIDYWRKRKAVPLDEVAEPVSDSDIEADTDRLLAAERVRAAINTLPDRMASVVTMRFMLHYSAKKTADNLGISVANVRVLQYRALKKLKGKL